MVRRARFQAAVAAALIALGACREKRTAEPPTSGAGQTGSVTDQGERPARPMPWDGRPVLEPGEAFALREGGGARLGVEDARQQGLLVVDLSDDWAPYIFSESDQGGEPKPQFYRQTFIDLANDRVDPDELLLQGGRTHALESDEEIAARKQRELEAKRKGRKPEPPKKPRRMAPVRNHLEVFGIPPTLSVLARRVEEDVARTCYATVDVEGLRQWDGEVTYQSAGQSKAEHAQALGDEKWVAQRVAEWRARDAGGGESADGGLPDEGTLAAIAAAAPKQALRIERWRRGQKRLRAVRAAQARLVCEGLLSPRSRFVDGQFDLPTHEALAELERKNDIFGWGFLSGETLEALQRPPMELHFETFRRVITERLVDAAGIIEDGSVSGGRRPAKYKDEGGDEHVVPNLVATHVDALLEAMDVRSGADLVRLVRALGKDGLARLVVAIPRPPLPPYYPAQAADGTKAEMELEVDIDRGDVWYDFPWDVTGKPIEQRRERYPSLTVFVKWNGQRIPLARWRTTIGSWRSEKHADGRIYYKYKSSDVGPRIWKNIIAAPVWIPPDGTPNEDLVTRKVFDRFVGPQAVVNTDVMGPGFQSAYGLVMAIHHKVTPGGGLFDNQIRTHGSVDYTSIARRFSHGCHRLVNTRAVRLFGFVLQHRAFEREGDQRISMRRRFTAFGKPFGFEMTTRGYWYRLIRPVPVNVLEGRIMGEVKKPILAYRRKPGVDYGPAPGDEEVTVAPEGTVVPPAPSTEPAVPATVVPAGTGGAGVP